MPQPPSDPAWPCSRGTPSVEEVARLVRDLRVFRFCGAAGGFAQDGDELVALIVAPEEAETRQLAARLGCLLDPSLPLSPRHASVAGVPCFLSFSGGLRLSISGAAGDPYRVTEADVARARALEGVLAGLPVTFRDPPVDSPRCFSPKHHPSRRSGL